MIGRCERCGGQVLNNYGEEICLQCGYDPLFAEAQKQVVERMSEGYHKLAKPDFKRSLSAKPSQIRRRRRRLLIKGYTEPEVEQVIFGQLQGGVFNV